MNSDLINFIREGMILPPHASIRDWQYPLCKKITDKYDFKSAQSLLEFTYRVSVHNKQITDDVQAVNIDAPCFETRIAIDTLILGQKVNVLNFYYSKKHNLIVLAFTATYNSRLWLVDLDFPQIAPEGINNYIEGMKMHRGFWTLYSSIQEKLLNTLSQYFNKSTQVLVCGLSLGGATSTICALDLFNRKINKCMIKDLIHYSFESPRVLNNTGAKWYDTLCINSFRIANNSDVITDLPLPLMPVSLNPFTIEDFTHVSGTIYYNVNLGSIYGNHVDACINEYNIKSLVDQ